MKNLNQRSKILIAIAAVVVVVAVIAVVVFTQLGGDELLGASVVGVSPSNPTIVVGKTVTLAASTSLSRCSWSSSNTAVATVASNNKSAVVTGVAVGQASIRVKCGLGATTGSTTVTVVTPPAVNPSSVGIFYPFMFTPTSATLNSGTGSVTWSIVSCVNNTGSPTWSPSSVLSLSTTTGPSVVVSSPSNPMPNKCVIQASVGGATSQATVCDNWRPDMTYTVSCP